MQRLLDRIRGLRLLVIGDSLLDHYVWGDASRISPEAPVPVMNVTRDTYATGGAANVALNLRALGCGVDLVGSIGSDADGDRLRDLLGSAGVETVDNLNRTPPPTIVKTRVMCRNQQLCRLDRESDPREYALCSDLYSKPLYQMIARSDGVILSDYAKGVVDNALFAFVVQSAHQTGRFVALDPKPRAGMAFTGVDLMTPNRVEAGRLARIEDAGCGDAAEQRVCARIHARYRPRILVVTLGADGMLLSVPGEPRRRVPTMARAVFDVSGAGDTVIAFLSAALCADAKLDEAARLANVAAGIVVSKLGTATATPEEILAFETV